MCCRGGLGASGAQPPAACSATLPTIPPACASHAPGPAQPPPLASPHPRAPPRHCTACAPAVAAYVILQHAARPALSAHQCSLSSSCIKLSWILHYLLALVGLQNLFCQIKMFLLQNDMPKPVPLRRSCSSSPASPSLSRPPPSGVLCCAAPAPHRSAVGRFAQCACGVCGAHVAAPPACAHQGHTPLLPAVPRC